MKALQNNFTTPEQSKRLLELGVPANSADFFFDRNEIEIDEHPYPYFIPQNSTFANYSIDFYIPCWSVGRLIEILTTCYKPIDWIEWCKEQPPIETILAELEAGIFQNLIDLSKL